MIFFKLVLGIFILLLYLKVKKKLRYVINYLPKSKKIVSAIRDEVFTKNVKIFYSRSLIYYGFILLIFLLPFGNKQLICLNSLLLLLLTIIYYYYILILPFCEFEKVSSKVEGKEFVKSEISDFKLYEILLFKKTSPISKPIIPDILKNIVSHLPEGQRIMQETSAKVVENFLKDKPATPPLKKDKATLVKDVLKTTLPKASEAILMSTAAIVGTGVSIYNTDCMIKADDKRSAAELAQKEQSELRTIAQKEQSELRKINLQRETFEITRQDEYKKLAIQQEIHDSAQHQKNRSFWQRILGTNVYKGKDDK